MRKLENSSRIVIMKQQNQQIKRLSTTYHWIYLKLPHQFRWHLEMFWNCLAVIDTLKFSASELAG